MSRRDPSVSLRQMRDHAQEVVELVSGRDRVDDLAPGTYNSILKQAGLKG